MGNVNKAFLDLAIASNGQTKRKIDEIIEQCNEINRQLDLVARFQGHLVQDLTNRPKDKTFDYSNDPEMKDLIAQLSAIPFIAQENLLTPNGSVFSKEKAQTINERLSSLSSCLNRDLQNKTMPMQYLTGDFKNILEIAMKALESDHQEKLNSIHNQIVH